MDGGDGGGNSPELRDKLAVLPRDAGYQCVLVGAILGAGIALSVLGFVMENTILWWGFPAAIALARVQNQVLPWSETRLLQELRTRETTTHDA